MSYIKEIQDKKKNEFKIITLGESGVGKTSIIKRFGYNFFDEYYISTIGLNFVFKEIKLKDNTKVTLKLIDTAGNEKYRGLMTSYFRNADAVLYVFSLDIIGSYEEIKEWKKKFRENSKDEIIPSFLIRNKCDLDANGEDFNEEIVEDLMQKENFLRFISVSAKDNKNLVELFTDIAEICYKKYSNIEDKNNIKLLKDDLKKKNKRKNCIHCTNDSY